MDGLPLNQCCERCQALFAEIRRRLAQGMTPSSKRERIPFHNIQALMSSAADGCHLCSLIMAELEPEHVHHCLEDLILHPEHAWDQLAIVTPSTAWVSSGPSHVRDMATLEESRERYGVSGHEALCHFAITNARSPARRRESLLACLPFLVATVGTWRLTTVIFRGCSNDGIVRNTPRHPSLDMHL
jgi:hypothetical protein